MKVLRGLNYEEILQALKLQPHEKNDLVLTYKILYNQIDLEAAQLFNCFQKDRPKKIINKTASKIRENPKKKDFMQDCYVL